eukprot:GHVS01105136.1.p1 GENE.GHVS01105136.1~~GHVS01105136.1.p1  ORF type:complete len:141 (+),score=18.84 GHVS01105136.1:238-660(+)
MWLSPVIRSSTLPHLRRARVFTSEGLCGVWGSIKRFQPRVFFEEHFFWNHANVGPLFITLLTMPFWYAGIKTMYWTCRYRTLDQQEIISDRLDWLHQRMLEDQVEEVLLRKVPRSGFPKEQPLILLGPSSLQHQQHQQHQ